MISDTPLFGQSWKIIGIIGKYFGAPYSSVEWILARRIVPLNGFWRAEKNVCKIK